ncbi:MAG: DUF2141 domain-containing protein [Bacteroidota bacterium]
MFKLLVSTFALYGLCGGFVQKSTLSIRIDNIKAVQGYVWVGVYDSEASFLNKELATAVVGKEVNTLGEIRFDIEDIQHGTYAVAVFHDLNGNGELDQGMFGIPKEPYAFSKPLQSKWRAPTFEDVRFQFTAEQANIAMRLDTW